MSGDELKAKLDSLHIDPETRYSVIRRLLLDGTLDGPVSSEEIVRHINEISGERWKTVWVQTYMRKFLDAGIIRAIKPANSNRNYWVIASVSREEALRSLGKNKKILDIEAELFSDELQKKMRKNFGAQLQELRSNFGSNPICTAFLLRKILEKLIIITMAKHGKEACLQDKARPGGWIGLKDMIESAAREKLNGVPFLIPRTANEIKGIKFLGDTAAHNPLIDVDIRTILPQMPYIITAYEELAERL